MSLITTHVLDTARGRPAAGVGVILSHHGEDGWHELARGRTNDDGRITDLLPADTSPPAGRFRLTFDTGAYFADHGVEGFFPVVDVCFVVADPPRHHHVPLLLSPYGYSTYRGS